jgi:hypothetical protein
MTNAGERTWKGHEWRPLMHDFPSNKKCQKKKFPNHRLTTRVTQDGEQEKHI